jgi:menaquinone-dependent protoporphyrinogen oxidase
MAGIAPTRTLVVAAASRHGSTGEIAERLARTLEKDLPPGWQVTRPDLSELSVLDDADAVVLGSAIYYGRWMRLAARALAYLKDAPLIDLWLFSTGPVSDIESENAQVISADEMVQAGQAIEHKVFGGRLDTSQLNWMERTVVKAVHAIPGDHRNWDEVDEWAHHIARQLSVVPDVENGTGLA